MSEIMKVTQRIFIMVRGGLGYFLGGYDKFLYALIVFVVVEYATGVFCAIADKKLCSSIGLNGVCKKVLIFTLVGIANTIDMQIIGIGAMFRIAVIFFYISCEGVSILENTAYLGLPIPEKLQFVLRQFYDKSKE